MKNTLKLIIASGFLLLNNIAVVAQCANTANIYSFVYNGKTYEVVKENKTWVNAAACAVERGGYLTEINDAAEQNAIYTELNTNAGITTNNTIAPDGGGGSYVWLGGNDMGTEGSWVWDGNNDNNGAQFWQGTSSGNPVGGLYSNWGNEPDDFNGQDALGLSLDGWPLGVASQWNDVDHTNMLYFVIEKPIQTGINEVNSNNDFQLYPNPAKNSITINNINNNVSKVLVINALGKTLQAIDVVNTSTKKIDIAGLSSGTYYIKALSLNGNTSIKKFIK